MEISNFQNYRVYTFAYTFTCRENSCGINFFSRFEKVSSYNFFSFFSFLESRVIYHPGEIHNDFLITEVVKRSVCQGGITTNEIPYIYIYTHIYFLGAGFSDPYCMLGIQPGNTGAPLSPQTNLTAHSPHTPPASPRQATRALSDGGETENSHHEKLRKHHR